MITKYRRALLVLALVVLSALVFLAARFIQEKSRPRMQIDWAAARARHHPASPIKGSLALPVPVSAPPAPAHTPFVKPDPCVTALLAGRGVMGLSLEQVATIGALVGELREERRNYERSIAQAHNVGAGKVLIEIPPYPEKGAEMLRKFNEAMATELGVDLAAKIEASSALVSLSADNNFFGKYVQRYEVSALPNGGFSINRDLTAPEGQPKSALRGIDVLPPSYFGSYQSLSDLFPR